MIVHGLSDATGLLGSFKQVSVDQTAEHRRQFDLKQICANTVAAMRSRITHHGHELVLDIPTDIVMLSYPGPLGQVLMNLIDNALIHAFQNHAQGHMRLSANQIDEQQVSMRFEDNGIGISQTNLGRVFEPFFTTRLGQGGSGLGLSICYNIVTSLLRGQIAVRSQENQGTCFELVLPLCIS